MADPPAAEPAGTGGGAALELPDVAATGEQQHLSKSARKKLLKRERLEKRKAERRAAEKERRRLDLERRRREWDERLAGAGEEERARLVAERREARLERMGRWAAERTDRADRLRAAADAGHRVALDLDFAELMTTTEIHSLVHQVDLQLMFCYAVNGKCATPAHLMLTGCKGEIQKQLERLPGYERWMLEKDPRSYIEAFEDQKEKLVYLTADSNVELDNLDLNKIYIIGGLVDRNRWKGITFKKAREQRIQTARLPISNYLKLSSSQVLTVNQVFEVLLKFIETKDWKDAFFKVIPQRKQLENEVVHGEESTENEDDCGHDIAVDLAIENEEENMAGEDEEKEEEEEEERETKRTRMEQPENGH